MQANIRFFQVMLFIYVSLFFPASFAAPCTETLKEAYFAMLDTNPNLLESQANQRAAWQAYLSLHGGLWPTLAFAYNVGRGKGESLSPQTLNIGYTVANIQHKMASVSQLLFDGGALMYKVASARTQFEVAKHKTALQQNVLALRVVSAYLAVMRSKEVLVIAKANVDEHAKRVYQAEERYRRGAGILSEYVQAQARMEQSRLILNQIELDLANARSSYREVVGHYPPEDLVPPAVPEYLLPATKAEMLDRSTLNSPAIRAEKCGVKSAFQEVQAARAVVLWPNAVLQMSVSRDNNLNGIESRTTSMQGYVALNYNLFHGGADIADMRKAAAQLVASKEHYESKIREVSLAIEQTWNELEVSKQDNESLRKHLISSNQAKEAYNQELKLGKRALIDVIEIEEELTNVRLAIVNTKYKIKIDTYSLLANAGLLSDYLCNA